MIKDSGNRTEFKSGAVRDIQEGKGRCDLLPLHVISMWLGDPIFGMIEQYRNKPAYDPTPRSTRMVQILDKFAEYCNRKGNDRYSLVLEVAKHFEEGAKKYGDRNWEKGIPCDRYIDSAVRHYCKWRAGWTDEPHDRAFIWNILCCEWTRQRYGWNLERLGEKNENDPTTREMLAKTALNLQNSWYGILGYDFEKEGQKRNGKDFLTQCLNRYYFRPVDEKESESKEKEQEQEIANLKEACAIIEHENACFESAPKDCWNKNCDECEHYIDPDITHKAVNKLYDYVKKSLKNTEAK